MDNKTENKKFRNLGLTDLVSYWLPMSGIVSILHRISGFLLFLSLAILLYLFDLSLSGPEGFQQAIYVLSMPIIKLLMIGFLWIFWHHVFAGIRFLLLDLHFFISKEASSCSAKVVLGLGLFLTVLCGVWLW